MPDCRRSAVDQSRRAGRRRRASIRFKMIGMTMRPHSLIAALCLAGAAACGWAQTAGSPAKPPTASAKPASAAAKPATNGAKVAPAEASAQAPSVIVKPAASAPVQAKRQTRPLTTAEKLESVAPPGELRPERTITPQITIPLSKTPPDATHSQGRSAGSAVNDSAGRCAAIADESQRARCREAAGLGKPKK